MRDRLSEGTRDEVMSVLSALFPSKAQLFQGTTAPQAEPHGEVVKRRGIGSKASYDAYFSLHPSSDAIPKTEIDALMRRLEDEEAIAEVIKSYADKKDKQGRPMVGELLEELRFRFEGRGPAIPTEFVAPRIVPDRRPNSGNRTEWGLV